VLTVAVAVVAEGIKLVDVTQTALVCERALIVAVRVIEDEVAKVEEAWVMTVPYGKPISVAMVVFGLASNVLAGGRRFKQCRWQGGIRREEDGG
jgi:hypothetical protein